ncbi:sugar phosphate isomerase/epimerase family protein [Lederbergia lenta]|uniref:L-xylulose 5-phosphate 3-epimerase n=1 Tax=Lederbergia lenta TaxID=1467 RepID=A0A2X4W6D0_LEDLE|nr:sugar phosphate isomerase/epimerase family protein [Lederbergia lenta]MCM3111226.1 sugar phosphate isomerase/epimerase [Lederbergia lenta]MEC2325386.1 sugar phosphate isomerase/epimerase [Lederbergia lenta]SQI55548.1 L-xylulose 5-phosphate 3-epimerase [Lederbergia lenta]
MGMDVGVVSRSFPKLSNKETAELLSSKGFKWTELCFTQTDSNYWVYNGRSDLNDLSNEQSINIVETYRENDIEVTAIGVFTNLLERDEKEAEKNLGYFERLMEIASINHIPYVSSECGFIPGRRGVNADSYEADFQRLVENLKWLAIKAKEYNVSIALEPCVLDVVPSAKRMVDLIDQVGSDQLKVLLDPANLIANNSEVEMFSYLSQYIAYFHGKDRKVNDTYGRIIGDGDIDWPLFFNLYHKYTEGVPFIMEYVNMENFTDVRDQVIRFDKKVSV